MNEDTAQLRIPNEAVRLCLTQAIEYFFTDKNPYFADAGRKLMQNFLLGRGFAANNLFTGILMRYVSVHDTPAESFSHDLLFNLLSSAQSQPIESSHEAKDGCSVIRFFDKASDTAVIIKLTEASSPAELSDTAHSAVAHIHKRRCYSDFRTRGVSHIRLYGIACCGKFCRTIMETLSEEP